MPMLKLTESVDGEGIEIMRADFTAKLKIHTNGISHYKFTIQPQQLPANTTR